MHYILALTLLLTPAYQIKFPLFDLPTNLLMMWVFLFWLIFAGYIFFKNQIKDFIRSILLTNKKVLTLVLLFFLSGLISLFTGAANQEKLGQFIVLFFQPITTFFIARFVIKNHPETTKLLLATCYLLLAITGLYAGLQYFTLLGLPEIYWGNAVEPKRSVAFFGHPNFYALFVTPILAFLVSDLRLKILDYKKYWPYVTAWGIGALGLFFSLSRAGWLGLLAAIALYIIIAADKQFRKIIFTLAILGLIIIAVTPNFRYRLLLPFYGEKSAVSRLSLWTTGNKAIKESPIFGLGLTGFSQNWDRLNADPNLETHNFPHNIFLNFWVETGLIGLISLMGLIGLIIYRGIKNRTDVIKLGIALLATAILIQGQIDNPYFKNDLAMVFWILLSFI